MISGKAYAGSVIVHPEWTKPWPVSDIGDLSLAGLEDIVAAAPRVEILLIGCGAKLVQLTAALRAGLREHGIVCDAMDTGAACRTFNVLSAEMRLVAAALIALPEDA